MPCHAETLPQPIEKKLIPEAQTHIDPKLTALINIALDNYDEQFFSQHILTTIGESENFSNYFNLLRSAINNPISAGDGNQYLDSRKNTYHETFLSVGQLPGDYTQPLREYFLTISRGNDSTFDINYSLITREFGHIPKGRLTQKSTYDPNSDQKLAGINIKIGGGSDPCIHLELYSDSRSSSVRSRCFRSPSSISLDENTRPICEDAYQYLSTLKLPLTTFEAHSPFH